ncbi:hypothetical protein EI975_07290 [Bacillus licheniformis]|uniref:hypothetical protein n=1 Tax=Bacillus licheniformis TaxID=1402 RepID=UPI0011EBE84E|nr:hypothetical protein [Bacillus licheniformis]KAA0815496.1 hypothetical protein EI974_16620 [Bacillus licheniformis]KAA0830945.1 hypothetical protein EI980_12315 [Bacillus licheniformis]KAA0847499.1 hypothetical protein EI975_07290 [Bacillus licheniformis]
MECQPNNDPQLLRDSNDKEIVRRVDGVYLRYPHPQHDKVPEVCRQVSEGEALKLIEAYNMFNTPQLKLDHVHVIHYDGETETDLDPWTNVSHWQWKGYCEFRTFVTCQ